MDKKHGWIIGAVRFTGNGIKHDVFWSGGNYSGSNGWKSNLTDATRFKDAEAVIDRLYTISEKPEATEGVVKDSIIIYMYSTELTPVDINDGVLKEERERRALKKLSFNDLEVLNLKEKAVFYKLSENKDTDPDDIPF